MAYSQLKVLIKNFLVYFMIMIGLSHISCYCMEENIKIKDIKETGNDQSCYGEFGNQNVLSVTTPRGKKIDDHQGHIIPQNQIARMLIPDHKRFLKKLKKTEEHTTDREEQKRILKEHFENPKFWNKYKFSSFANYDEGLLYLNSSPSEILSTLYSMIIWNPANICRAPEDEHRGGYPGGNVDELTLEALKENPNYPLLKKCTAEENPKEFMKTWKKLKDSWIEGDPSTGYYRFNWDKEGDNYKPKSLDWDYNLDWDRIQNSMEEKIEKHMLNKELPEFRIDILLSKSISDWSQLISNNDEFKQEIEQQIHDDLISTLSDKEYFKEKFENLGVSDASYLVKMEVIAPLLKRALSVNEEGLSYISEVISKSISVYIQHNIEENRDLSQILEAQKEFRENTISEIENQQKVLEKVESELSEIKGNDGEDALQKKEKLEKKIEIIKAELEKKESELKEAERKLEYGDKESLKKHEEEADKHIKERSHEIFRGEK